MTRSIMMIALGGYIAHQFLARARNNIILARVARARIASVAVMVEVIDHGHDAV